MSWRPGSLQELFNTGTEFEWAAYHFVTNDPLEEALQPGYFARWGNRLRPGDLIFFGCNEWRGRQPSHSCRGTAVRRALLMVVEAGQGRAVVRLAQDWGGVDAVGGGTDAGAGARAAWRAGRVR
jgi:hypothetical protein